MHRPTYVYHSSCLKTRREKHKAMTQGKLMFALTEWAPTTRKQYTGVEGAGQCPTCPHPHGNSTSTSIYLKHGAPKIQNTVLVSYAMHVYNARWKFMALKCQVAFYRFFI